MMSGSLLLAPSFAFGQNRASTDPPGSFFTESPENAIDTVLEYCPAPGQFMNGLYSAYQKGDNYAKVLARAHRVIAEREEPGLLSLGGYGGYIVVRMRRPIVNFPNQPDFECVGNALFPSEQGASSEPGIVWVMEDSNGNGLPDDQWYEIKGSEYDRATANYKITYHRPAQPLGEVPWEDNQDKSGVIPRNEYHEENSYYPGWVSRKKMTFEGRLLPPNVQELHPDDDPSITLFSLQPFEYGYADNYNEGHPKAGLDLEDAISTDGTPHPLRQAHFVKVYTGLNQVVGVLGETSTEFSSIRLLPQDTTGTDLAKATAPRLLLTPQSIELSSPYSNDATLKILSPTGVCIATTTGINGSWSIDRSRLLENQVLVLVLTSHSGRVLFVQKIMLPSRS